MNNMYVKGTEHINEQQCRIHDVNLPKLAKCEFPSAGLIQVTEKKTKGKTKTNDQYIKYNKH